MLLHNRIENELINSLGSSDTQNAKGAGNADKILTRKLNGEKLVWSLNCTGLENTEMDRQ